MKNNNQQRSKTNNIFTQNKQKQQEQGNEKAKIINDLKDTINKHFQKLFVSKYAQKEASSTRIATIDEMTKYEQNKEFKEGRWITKKLVAKNGDEYRYVQKGEEVYRESFFKDKVFVGELENSYTRYLKQFFELKGYQFLESVNANDFLKQESPTYNMVDEAIFKNLKDENGNPIRTENRFNDFDKSMRELSLDQELFNKFVEQLKKSLNDKMIPKTQPQQSPKSSDGGHRRVSSDLAKSSSLKSLNENKIKSLIEGSNDEFKNWVPFLYNGFNIYSLIESLYYFLTLQQRIQTYVSPDIKNKKDYTCFVEVETEGKLKEYTSDIDPTILSHLTKNPHYNAGVRGIYYAFLDKKIIIKTDNILDQAKADKLILEAQKSLAKKSILIDLSNQSNVPELFVERLVNNFKDTFGKEIEVALKETIASIADIPKEIDQVFDLLKNNISGEPSIVSQLEAVKITFTDCTENLESEIKKFVGENGDLTKLFNYFKIDSSYFDSVGKSLNQKISEYVESLKIDIEDQIREKEFVINEIKGQYLAAYNKVAHEEAKFIGENVVEHIRQMAPEEQEKIKDNLPLWVRDGFDLVDVGIKNKGKPVKFIFNKPQADIIKALKNNDPSKKLKFVSSKDFYVGTGGGKTHLINLLQGSGQEIKGSDGKPYQPEAIKKAIFGDANVLIKSINFHIFYNGQDYKEPRQMEKEIDKIFYKLKQEKEKLPRDLGIQDAQYIIPLDEYHLFPDYAKEYLRKKAEENNIKTLFIKSTATPDIINISYKSLKNETKTNYEEVAEDNKSKIAKIKNGINKINYNNYKEAEKGAQIKVDVAQTEAANIKNNTDKINYNIDQFVSKGKKYHIIIDPSIVDGNSAEDNSAILKCWEKIATQNKQKTLVIARKNEEGDSYYYLFNSGNLIKTKPDKDGNRFKILNATQLKEELSDINKKLSDTNNEIKLIYPFSTATGGDFGIDDFAGNTKITVKITDDMKAKYSATEMVAFIRQAVGRDRSFNWEDNNSFENVELIGIEQQKLKEILEKAENFENLKEKIEQGNNEEIASADPKKSYCEKDIKKIKDLIFSRLKKDDLASFDTKTIANIFSAIELFKAMNLSYQDIYEKTSQFYPKSLDNIKKFDAIFSLHKLFKFIVSVNQQINTQINTQKIEFVDAIMLSYEKVHISREAIIKKLTGDKTLENVIKDKIFSKEFIEKLEEKDLVLQRDDLNISSPELVINNGKFDIEFDYNLSLSNDTSAKNEELKALLKRYTNSESQRKVKFSTIQEPAERSQTKSFKIEKLEGNNNEFFNPDIDDNNEFGEKARFDFIIPLANNTKAEPKNSVEAKAIYHLFEKVLDDKDNKFTDNDKELIRNFYSPSSPDKTTSEKAKIAIVESALSERNKYDQRSNRNESEDRAGKNYSELKKLLRGLNENNINFTTESLKLFNVSNETLGTRQEIDELMAKKPLFVRAMKDVGIIDFKSITKNSLEVDSPSNNILLAKPDGVSSKDIRVKLMKLRLEINNTK